MLFRRTGNRPGIRPPHMLGGLLFAILSVVSPIASAQGPFVTVDKGAFRLAGKEYRAMGFTAYELNVGIWKRSREQIEKVFRSAREHGFTLYRATSIIMDFGKGDLEQHLSEKVWTQVDIILDVARSLDMKVLIDFSTMTYAAGKYADPPFDVTAPEHFDRIKKIYSVIPNRRNTINGRIYKKDRTILGYSILGEIVPFPQRRPDGTIDLTKEGRDVNNYISFISLAAAELKRNDPLHLVNAGGLLHLKNSNVRKDKTGADYWKTVWSDHNIDFGSIHIYSGPPKETPLPARPPYSSPMPWGEWNNLAEYVAYTDNIAKPFVLEEWGVDLDKRAAAGDEPRPKVFSPQCAQEFFTTAFSCMASAKVPVSIMWQWSPGGHFNIWPGESEEENAIVNIIRKHASSFHTR